MGVLFVFNSSLGWSSLIASRYLVGHTPSLKTFTPYSLWWGLRSALGIGQRGCARSVNRRPQLRLRFIFNVLPEAGEPTSILDAIAGPPDPQSFGIAQDKSPNSNLQSAHIDYGWNEDIRCYSAALLLATEYLTLSDFNKTHLTAHADSYFATDWAGLPLTNLHICPSWVKLRGFVQPRSHT